MSAVAGKGARVSPLVLRVLLHIYYSPDRWIDVEKASPAAAEAHHLLYKWGLIVRRDDEVSLSFTHGAFVLTAGGEKYVDMVLSTPLPVLCTKWVDPRDEVKT